MSVRIVLYLALCGLLGCAGNSRAPIEDRAAQAQLQPQNSSYTVKRGDTLYSIAFRYGKDFREVAAANGIAAPYTIYPGQQIRLDEKPRAAPAATAFPAAATPVVVPPASSRTAPTPTPVTPAAARPRPVLSPAYPRSPPPVAPAQASVTPPPAPAPEPAASAPVVAPPGPRGPQVSTQPAADSGQTAAIVPAAPQVSPTTPEAATSGAETFAGEEVAVWRWPTSGPVIRGYSESLHKGIDIGGARGDPVTAVAAGKVVYAGTGIAGFGELLIIKHNDVYLSAYGHNDELLVAEGDTVAAGQAIAQKGSSGTDAVKLHFEIRQEGKPIDPQRLLPGR